MWAVNFGSFESNTKICEFDEYDINIVLKLPFDQSLTNLKFAETNVRDLSYMKPNLLDIDILTYNCMYDSRGKQYPWKKTHCFYSTNIVL